MIKAVVGGKASAAVIELEGYLLDSFGNATRLDYGSGHELAFAAFLCCLAVLEVFEEQDFQALVLRVFNRYLQLVRKVQRIYSLEPAGSHGVWGLDDHQFLCYLWGSSQCMRGDIEMWPQDIGNVDSALQYAEDNLFFAARKSQILKSRPFLSKWRKIWI